VGSGDLYDQLRQKVPAELGFEFNPVTVYDYNNYRVKFVYFGSGPVKSNLDNLIGMNDKHVTAIQIQASGSSGTVSFYEKLDDQWVGAPSSVTGSHQSKYVYLESIIAAIFAQDIEMYECGMEKAFKRLNIIADVYSRRSVNLTSLYNFDGNSNCANQHSSAAGPLSSLMGLGFSGANNIPGIETGLAAINNRAQIYSCALIY